MELLGDISDFEVMGVRDLALKWLDRTDNGSKQAGFTGSIGTNDCYDFSRVDP